MLFRSGVGQSVVHSCGEVWVTMVAVEVWVMMVVGYVVLVVVVSAMGYGRGLCS